MFTPEIFFIVTDAKGDASEIAIQIPIATSFADYPRLVRALGDLINPLITGGLKQAGFRATVDLGAFGWGPVALLVSDVQEKGEFVFRTVNGFLKRLNLPTFDEQFFVPNSNLIDLADPLVAAFTDAMVDGVDLTALGGTTVDPVDTRNEDLVALTRATENWGKRRL